MTASAHTPSISVAAVFRLGLGGALGGLISFMLLDPQMRVDENMGGALDLSHGLQIALTGLLTGVFIGACIGAMLILADEIQSPNLIRMARGLLLGVVTGGLIGCIGVFCADMIYSPMARSGVMILQIVGRVLGWAIMGAAAGLTPGIVAKSRVRIVQGATGGIIGGAIGGILFDQLAALTSGGSVSRFVGFVIMGLAIGIAVGLIGELGKVYWLSAISGSKEGRTIVLTKPLTMLGRDELVDVPLFGDSTIQKQHAVISTSAAGAEIAVSMGAVALVNGSPLQRTALMDGDIIEIGRHRFRFHSRVGAPIPIAAPDYRLPIATPPAFPGSAPISPGAVMPGMSAGPVLQVVAGPHTGLVFTVFDGAIIGRDPRCDLALTLDNRLSRQHARFINENGGWAIEDGNSSNGTIVNGVRVARQSIAPGDQIGAGDTVMLVG